MLRYILGTPVNAVLFGLYGFFGPMLVAIRGELANQRHSKFHSPWIKCAAPVNFFVLAITLFLLFTIRHLEHVIGSLNFFFVLSFSYLADLAFRVFLERTFSIAISASGPYAVLAALFGLYSVFVPTVRARLMAVNEKVLALILFMAIGILDDFRALACVAVGFVVFLLTGPFCFPSPTKK
jgi:hypothetical protein